MNNELVFIRHAKTKVDKQIPIEDWILTTEGFEQSQEVASIGDFQDADILISSKEEKSYLTLKPLADKLGKKIVKVSELGEIKRPNSEKLTLEEYEEMKVKIFQDLNYSNYGWETANSALSRFKQAIEKIDNKHANKKIIICAHGTVMTLYFASLAGEMNNLMKRWKGLEFGAVGIIKNNNLVRDIVK